MITISKTARRVVFASCLAIAYATPSWAQQTQTVTLPSVVTNFTQQHMMEVGDVPNHQLRLFEYTRSYGADGPVIAGVHLKEALVHGMTNYTNSTGSGEVYQVLTMANGDKVYAHGTVVSHGAPASNGKRSWSSLAAFTITGGTGKFSGLRGLIRSETNVDPAANQSTSKGEIEYWMEK